MKQILLMIALVGCGKKEPVQSSMPNPELVQPTTPDTEAPKPESTKAKASGGEKGREEKTDGLESYLPGKRIVFGQPVKSLEIWQNSECIKNMSTLKGAIVQWGFKLSDNAKVTLDDLAPYLKAGTKSLKCPAGGKYILTTVGEDPKCSHGHSLDYERGDKLPPAKGPPPSAPLGFWQFNKDGTLQWGTFVENGDAKETGDPRTGKATYKVTGPMEVTLEADDEEEKPKMIFTKPKPGKGDALTLRMPDGREKPSKAPILEVTPASPLKKKK